MEKNKKNEREKTKAAGMCVGGEGRKGAWGRGKDRGGLEEIIAEN